MLRQALEQAPDLDGVFCTNDDIAAGALLAAQAMQLAVPQRLAVAGFNALDIGDALHPVLASVVTPREAIGRLAAQRLLGRIHGQRYADAVVDLATRCARAAASRRGPECNSRAGQNRPPHQ